MASSHWETTGEFKLGTSASFCFQPTFGLLDDNGVEEAFPSDCGHDVSGQLSQLASQQLSHPLSVLRQPLLLQHLSRRE